MYHPKSRPPRTVPTSIVIAFRGYSTEYFYSASSSSFVVVKRIPPKVEKPLPIPLLTPQFLTQTNERMNKRMTSPSQNVALFPEG